MIIRNEDIKKNTELLNEYIHNAWDDFITYRENAWSNLEENKLLAFCLFGEEDSLLYIGLSDGAVYYLSTRYKIADSLNEFLDLINEKCDYFLME